jgi:hypothetical protein
VSKIEGTDTGKEGKEKELRPAQWKTMVPKRVGYKHYRRNYLRIFASRRESYK